MKIIKVDTTSSTNALAASMASEGTPLPFAVMCREQTAGRGQRGNTWEAASGKNITLSIAYQPSYVVPADQFVISQAVAVSIVETLRHYLPAYSKRIAIKWPNDIYVDSLKICGILIENTLTGTNINRTIIGIGLNVNQTEFLSSAPNPISMRQLTGMEYDPDEIASFMCSTIERFLENLTAPSRRPHLRGLYFSMLWNSSGYHPYIDAASSQRFTARISDIAASGHITLTEPDGRQRVYAFKEVQAVIEPTPGQ